MMMGHSGHFVRCTTSILEWRSITHSLLVEKHITFSLTYGGDRERQFHKDTKLNDLTYTCPIFGTDDRLSMTITNAQTQNKLFFRSVSLLKILGENKTSATGWLQVYSNEQDGDNEPFLSAPLPSSPFVKIQIEVSEPLDSFRFNDARSTTSKRTYEYADSHHPSRSPPSHSPITYQPDSRKRMESDDLRHDPEIEKIEKMGAHLEQRMITMEKQVPLKTPEIWESEKKALRDEFERRLAATQLEAEQLQQRLNNQMKQMQETDVRRQDLETTLNQRNYDLEKKESEQLNKDEENKLLKKQLNEEREKTEERLRKEIDLENSLRVNSQKMEYQENKLREREMEIDAMRSHHQDRNSSFEETRRFDIQEKDRYFLENQQLKTEVSETENLKQIEMSKIKLANQQKEEDYSRELSRLKETTMGQEKAYDEEIRNLKNEFLAKEQRHHEELHAVQTAHSRKHTEISLDLKKTVDDCSAKEDMFRTELDQTRSEMIAETRSKQARITELQWTHDEAERKIKMLSQELESRKFQFAELEITRKSLNSEKSSLKENLDAQESKMDTLRDEANRIRSELDEAKIFKLNYDEEKKKFEQATLEMENKYKNEKKQREEIASTLSEETIKFSHNNNSMEKKIIDAMNQLTLNDDEKAKLQGELDQLNYSFEEKNKLYLQLLTQFKQLSNRETELKSSLEQTQRGESIEITTLRNTLSEKHLQLSNFETRLREKEDEVQKLIEEAQKEKESRNNQSLELTQKMTRIQEVEGEREQKDIEIENIKKEREKIKGQLENEINQVKTEREEMKERLEQIREQLTEKDNKVQTLTVDLGEKDEMYKRALHVQLSATENLANKESDFVQIRDKFTIAMQEKGILETEKQNLQAEKQNLEKEKIQIQDNLEKEKKQKETLQITLNNEQEINQALKKQKEEEDLNHTSIVNSLQERIGSQPDSNEFKLKFQAQEKIYQDKIEKLQEDLQVQKEALQVQKEAVDQIGGMLMIEQENGASATTDLDCLKRDHEELKKKCHWMETEKKQIEENMHKTAVCVESAEADFKLQKEECQKLKREFKERIDALGWDQHSFVQTIQLTMNQMYKTGCDKLPREETSEEMGKLIRHVEEAMQQYKANLGKYEIPLGNENTVEYRQPDSQRSKENSDSDGYRQLPRRSVSPPAMHRQHQAQKPPTQVSGVRAASSQFQAANFAPISLQNPGLFMGVNGGAPPVNNGMNGINGTTGPPNLNHGRNGVQIGFRR